MKHFALFVSLIMVAVMVSNCSDKQAPKKPAFDITNIDSTVSPANDFFKFATNGWAKNNPIPDEYSRWGTFEELYEESYAILNTILEETKKNDSAEKGSETQLVRDFYIAGMDTLKIESDGLTPLNKELEIIDAVANRQDLIKAAAYLNTVGHSPFFSFYIGVDDKNSGFYAANIWQGGYGLPDVDYYRNDDERSVEVRTKYVEHITNMFVLSGKNEADSKVAAEAILDIETLLAKAGNRRVDNRDPNVVYNKTTANQLSKLAPDFDWNLFFNSIGWSNADFVIVGQPKSVKEVGKIVGSYDLDKLKDYLRWNVLQNNAYLLSSNFVNERFEFSGKFLNGSKSLSDRWKRVLQNANGSIGDALGQLYVKEAFPPEAKERARKIVDNLLVAMGESIRNLEWMGEETKQMALKKLEGFGVKIGYPDKWEDYSALDINKESYLRNVLNASLLQHEKDIKKIGRPVEAHEWSMVPQMVNAYYSPTRNEIVFPAAILQPPFFNANADDAINYGAMGAVIGHEVTHGFDDSGRQYDVEGNINDWWTKEDSEKFSTRTDVLVKQFDAFNPIDDMHLDGTMTLGENIGDLGGLTVSFNAFKKTEQYKGGKLIDGFTPAQRFFLAWTQVWKSNMRDEYLKLVIKIDVHSPAPYRINGPFPNMPEFVEAFNIQPGDGMWIAPEERVKIW